METIGYMYAEDRELKLLRPLMFSKPQTDAPEGFEEVQLVRRRDAEREIDFLLAVLKDIGDFAHDRSTGPAVEDDLWEVRRMAYEALTHNAPSHRPPSGGPVD